jgi:mono/diheme cytochrome c family protein
MNLRNPSAWVRAAGLAAALAAVSGLVACDSGAADTKKAEAAKAVADKAAETKAAADKLAADAKAAADKAAAEAKAAEEKVAAEAKAAADKLAAEAKAADDAKLAGIDGKALYESKCKSCHAIDGKGTAAMKKNKIPDMTDAGWQGAHDRAKVVAVVTDGIKDTKMGSFKAKLKPEEIEAVAVYVKTMK